MDVHRCRFVPYPPSSINALAFSTSASRTKEQPLKLAVGRSNGNIEIWDPKNGTWIHERTFYGGRDRSVEGLAWTQDPPERDDQSGLWTPGQPRLFSIGYSSIVTEWDLASGQPLRQSNAGQSEVWCLAAQPLRSNGRKTQDLGESNRTAEEWHGQDIAVGCADGSIALLSTEDSGLEFKRYISRTSQKKARALSIVWQNRDTIATGYADSTIRVYDVRNGSLLRSISVATGPVGGPKETLVWALESLKDGTLVSGDSNGQITFWDSKTFGQIQRIQGHEADVLCLASSRDANTLFSGGIDRRTVVYKRQGSGGRANRWIQVDQRRAHQHDIKAMAGFENDSTSVVVSGGLDTSLVLTPMRNYGGEYHRTLPFVPQQSSVAAAGRLLVSWWNNQIMIWRIHASAETERHRNRKDNQHRYTLASRIVLKSEENIVTGCISSNGDFVAVSTAAETKIFQLRESTLDATKLRVRKITSPEISSRLVLFSPDTRWLLTVDADSIVRLIRVAAPGPHAANVTNLSSSITLERPQRLQPGSEKKLSEVWTRYNSSIKRASFSCDGRILAVSDLAGNIDTWFFEEPKGKRGKDAPLSTSHHDLQDASTSSESEDGQTIRDTRSFSAGSCWQAAPPKKRLPTLSSQPLVLSFRPLPHSQPDSDVFAITDQSKGSSELSTPDSSMDHLFVLTAAHEMFEFCARSGSLTAWSRRNPTSSLPAEFHIQMDRAVDCLWDVQKLGRRGLDRARVWLYGATWLCMIDLKQDLPRPPEIESSQALVLANSEGQRRKRKRDGQEIPNYSQLDAQRQFKLLKHTAGAGNKKRDGEAEKGMHNGSVVQLTRNGEKVSDVAADAIDQSFLMDGLNNSDDAESSSETGLRDLRRSQPLPVTEIEDGDGIDNGIEASKLSPDGSAAFYLTVRYRSILGVVPIGSQRPEIGRNRKGGSQEGVINTHGTFQPLEVAVIERPFWDLDLPPRFHGMKEKRMYN